jgi:hypothetical protein
MATFNYIKTKMELYISEWNNLIKITYLICPSVGGPKKPLHASDPGGDNSKVEGGGILHNQYAKQSHILLSL